MSAPAPLPSPDRPAGSNKTTFPPARYACFGTFHLDFKKEELFRDGVRVKLQGKVYQALFAVLQKPGEIVTREELRAQLWPSDTHVNYDANVNTTVNKLRLVLGDSSDQPAFLDTITRKGYSFVAKVEYLDEPRTPLQAPPPEEVEPVAGGANEPAEGKLSFVRAALTSRWFTAGVVSLVIASMLFGAALVLYAHH